MLQTNTSACHNPPSSPTPAPHTRTHTRAADQWKGSPDLAKSAAACMAPTPCTALKSDYVAKVFCDEEDHSIRVTPVMIPSPIIAPKIVPASQVVPSPKPVHIPFKKRVRIMHAVSNLIYL